MMVNTAYNFKYYIPVCERSKQNLGMYGSYLPVTSYIKETMLSSIWDNCPGVTTVFAKRPVCHDNQYLTFMCKRSQ